MRHSEVRKIAAEERIVGERIARALADCNPGGTMLYPKPGVMKTAFDESYVMASLGVLAKTDPKSAAILLKQSLRFA